MNNKIYTTRTLKLRSLTPLSWLVPPSLLTQESLLNALKPTRYSISALKLCTYQCQAPDVMHLWIIKIRTPKQKNNGKKYGLLVLCSLQLNDQLINVPTLGRLGTHVTVKFSVVARPTPSPHPPPSCLTLIGALRLKKIINTLVKSTFICCSTNNNVGADNW